MMLNSTWGTHWCRGRAFKFTPIIKRVHSPFKQLCTLVCKSCSKIYNWFKYQSALKRKPFHCSLSYLSFCSLTLCECRCFQSVGALSHSMSWYLCSVSWFLTQCVVVFVVHVKLYTVLWYEAVLCQVRWARVLRGFPNHTASSQLHHIYHGNHDKLSWPLASLTFCSLHMDIHSMHSSMSPMLWHS